MRPRRVKWLAAAGLGMALAGYAAGRRHQRDTVQACLALAGSVDRMVTMYDAANTAMWEALGAVARLERERDVDALPASDALQ